jgi:hypothetical protein
MSSGDMHIAPQNTSHAYDEDDEVIQYDHWNDAWQKNDSSVSQNDDIIDTILKNVKSSNAEFKMRTKAFLEDWRDVFSRTLAKEPANLTPLEIQVDAVKWKTKKSQGPPRMMSFEKEQHIRSFVEEGLANNIIRPSSATHYSQVHLVPKPPSADGTKKMRTTIDFRYLNECSTPMSWPLPNIAQMLQRIGKAKPKCFAKLDMTSGYWQAPLAESSKPFTAFITFMGIFEWNRVAMGTQSAGGYFHYNIAFVVLAGLVYTILEAYLDDICIHAPNEQELWDRLTTVLTRFRLRNIKFNPDKVFISDESMEFVGHEITTDGTSFSKHKLNGVKLIPLPITKGDLKKFLGVANYFRDHVRDHSQLAHPLNVMLPNYTRTHRNHRLQWSAELEAAFFTLRDSVADCPKLFFMNDNWEIVLETDASDYGIGAVLAQIEKARCENYLEPIMNSFSTSTYVFASKEEIAHADGDAKLFAVGGLFLTRRKLVGIVA